LRCGRRPTGWRRSSTRGARRWSIPAAAGPPPPPLPSPPAPSGALRSRGPRGSLPERSHVLGGGAVVPLAGIINLPQSSLSLSPSRHMQASPSPWWVDLVTRPGITRPPSPFGASLKASGTPLPSTKARPPRRSSVRIPPRAARGCSFTLPLVGVHQFATKHLTAQLHPPNTVPRPPALAARVSPATPSPQPVPPPDAIHAPAVRLRFGETVSTALVAIVRGAGPSLPR